jgi:putative membrane protein
MKVPALLLRGVFTGAILFAPATAFADRPDEFLHKALKGDNSEIMLGQLAADHAFSPAVRDYGRTLVRDHQQARDEVLRVGRRFRLDDTRAAVPEAYREQRDLSRMHGPRFDREFINYMVDDHRKDVEDFKDEARERHGAVSELARRQLPTLRKHLDMALELQRETDRSADADHDRYNRHDRYDRYRR